MKLVINNDLSDIYYNYLNNNFKQINIAGENNKYSIKIVEKNKLHEPFEKNDLISRMSPYNLINLIVCDFLSNKIDFCQKNISIGDNTLYIENNRGQLISIKSSNLMKNFPLILDLYDEINIVADDTYNMINNGLVEKIEIHYTKILHENSKSFIYYQGAKLLKILITGDLENIEEIKDLIDYYKEVSGNYNKLNIIDFNSKHHKQIINFDSNREITIYGKEIIEYLERGKVYGKINNGKISKFV